MRDLTTRTTRWKVRECACCDRLWPMEVRKCEFCARHLDVIVDVVLAHSARVRDPKTSHKAALKLEPKATSRRGRILAYLQEYGPATARQIEMDLQMPGAWKRVSELKQGNHIHEVATRFDRLTRSEVTVFKAGPRPVAPPPPPPSDRPALMSSLFDESA